MFTALIVLGSILAYATAGRTFEAAARRAWNKGDPRTLAARTLLPWLARSNAESFGQNGENYHYGDSAATDRVLFWPFILITGLFLLIPVPYGKIASGFNRLTSWPARQISAGSEMKALPELASGEDEVGSDTPEQRYLIASGRERELLAQLDAVRFERAAAAGALGGEAEASKLSALPGSKL